MDLVNIEGREVRAGIGKMAKRSTVQVSTGKQVDLRDKEFCIPEWVIMGNCYTKGRSWVIVTKNFASIDNWEICRFTVVRWTRGANSRGKENSGTQIHLRNGDSHNYNYTGRIEHFSKFYVTHVQSSG